jgi:hypothetical protein
MTRNRSAGKESKAFAPRATEKGKGTEGHGEIFDALREKCFTLRTLGVGERTLPL